MGVLAATTRCPQASSRTRCSARRRGPGYRRRTDESCRSAPRRGRRARPADDRDDARSARRSRIGIVPPTIHRPSCSAVSARNCCAGPSPKRSIAATRSASVAPRNEKFSGSTTSFAPCVAASATRRPASRRLACTSRVLVICTAATFIRPPRALGGMPFGGSSAHNAPSSSCSFVSRSTVGSLQLPVTQYDARPMPPKRLLEDAREEQQRGGDLRARRATRRPSAISCRARP